MAKSEKGRGYGALLLLEAMNRVCRAGKNVGGFALFVDAKEGAISFYEHFGFRPMVNDRKVLVLPIASMPNFPDEI